MTDSRGARDVVQLGFSQPIDDELTAAAIGHRSPRWSDWDGGKIGGMPSWLNPRDLPRGIPFRCQGPCSSKEGSEEGTILQFIAQLYCPADDTTENDAAFHRSIYIFACPTCCATASSVTTSTEDDNQRRLFSTCVRVLRCQLPKCNDFYPLSCSKLNVKGWTKHTSQYWAEGLKDETLNLCDICGQRSIGNCTSKQTKKKLWFCCSEHDKELSLQLSTTPGVNIKSNNKTSNNAYIFHESELVVEDEPHRETNVKNNNEVLSTPSTMMNQTQIQKELDDYISQQGVSPLFESSSVIGGGGNDIDDANLTQSDLNAMTGMALTGVTDPVTLAFYHRMNIGGTEGTNDVRGQCLRYTRWPCKKTEEEETEDRSNDGEDDEHNGPLWLSSNNRPPITIFPPTCQYCGSPRDFEFQILPQMLSCLMVPSTAVENNALAYSKATTAEADLAVLMETASMIESGMVLPVGFKERHDEVCANARSRLLGVAPSTGVNGSLGSGSVDWGTIAVYTCTGSCGNGELVCEETGCYREEVAWMQPPLD